ncbi:protein NRT1/ PTR FAMILY 1.2-like [Ziziphus jujuba]|nr:protein NRT1/ PTR FAMILY 1.2-like [Ziziphus jujuba]XP_048331580.1 protein NRT1/ PTR FAMILY 1.2-like [Ziziphus jujuba]XP_048331581.1 protein NRT1/ PTR FAMILY 1.2-like [Ziziphus jujuba]
MATTPTIEENGTMKEPLLRNSNSKGGVRTLPFIIANEAFERVASHGLQPNMILYLTKEYALSAARAANILFLWSAATNFTPIVGAFLADSYMGRYSIIGFGSIISLLGMVLLWLTALIPQARPFCDRFSCTGASPATSQLLHLYSCFGLMSIGAGGIRSSSLAFGADQLDTGNSLKDAGLLERFFSWYYVSITVSVFVAVSGIVYIQDNMGWEVGFGVPVLLMLLSAISFFLASPFYVKLKSNKSLLTSFAQVLVASYKNRDIQLSSCGTDDFYYHTKGTVSRPSENLRFLNRACIIRNPQQNFTPDGKVSDPWSLCTVNQVDELKALIKVMPIWSTGVMMSVTMSQNSFPVLQATSMDRHVTSNFEIPAGSLGLFTMTSMIVWVALYNRIILPVASKIKGKSVRLSLKERMGIGIIICCIAMAVSGMVESIRREIAIQQGFSDEPEGVVNMSAMWLAPQNILLGIAESFNAIGQSEFFYTELPKSMSSIASALFILGMSVGNLASSFIMNTVDAITKRGNGESWVSSNINKGHYDYYCWLLGCLSFVNFLYFLACCKAYGPCKDERNGDLGGDGEIDE